MAFSRSSWLAGGLLALAVLVALIVFVVNRGSSRPDEEWRYHGGDPGHRQYSRLSQIDRSNVSRLQVAWTYRTGDADGQGRSQIQCNPIVVRAVLYATSPQLKVFALDAASGRELWR